MSEYRFRRDVVIEPLVSNYPAWWCTMAPIPAAMHAARYQIPTLEAYLEDPEASSFAATEEELFGGPFVAIAPERAGDVARFLEQLKEDYASSLAFAQAYVAFDAQLQASARGGNLERLYAEMPVPLRGVTELIYDYWNRPSVRVDERMAYATTLNPKSFQSFRIFRLDNDAQRPFFVPTPALPLEGASDLHVSLPFNDEAARGLAVFAARGGRPAALADLLSTSVERLHPFLEPVEATPPAEPWTGEGLRCRYVGHACVLVEYGGHSILLDPFVEAVPSSTPTRRLSYDDLPARIDFAVVTHGHPDHLNVETLYRLLPRIDCIVVPRALGYLAGDFDMATLLRRLGHSDVREVAAFDRLRCGELELMAWPFLGEHGDIGHGGKATYLVRAGDRKLFFAADALFHDIEVANILRREVGPIEHVFLNTERDGAPLSWPYEALFPPSRNNKGEAMRKCRGANADEGMALLQALGARHAFNYAMGLEPWLRRIIGPASNDASPRMQEATRLKALAEGAGISYVLLKGSRDLVF